MSAPSGGIDGEDRVKNRHFGDTSFEILAANIGLFEQTVSNWDFINPNGSAADGFRITVLVLPAAGTPSKTSMYTGGLSPWQDVTISADGTETFKGTLYNRFDIDFTDAKNWDDNPWVLVVFTPGGGINFDRMLYFPKQNYPRSGYGGGIERVRDWAYVHE